MYSASYKIIISGHVLDRIKIKSISFTRSAWNSSLIFKNFYYKSLLLGTIDLCSKTYSIIHVFIVYVCDQVCQSSGVFIEGGFGGSTFPSLRTFIFANQLQYFEIEIKPNKINSDSKTSPKRGVWRMEILKL